LDRRRWNLDDISPRAYEHPQSLRRRGRQTAVTKHTILNVALLDLTQHLGPSIGVALLVLLITFGL
jgi:hypothetical protein